MQFYRIQRWLNGNEWATLATVFTLEDARDRRNELEKVSPSGRFQIMRVEQKETVVV